jgi:hypothetical protein
MSAYTVDSSVQIIGVKEALRELNKIDKVARRQLTKDYKEIVSPVLEAAKSFTPQEAPLSGMGYRWNPGHRGDVFPWDGAKEDRGMKPFVSGKKPKQFGGFTSHLATFGIRWSTPGATVVEMSGKGKVPTEKGKIMVQALSNRYGQPGRFLWRAYTEHAEQVQRNVEQLVKDLMRRVNEELK